MDKIAYKWSTHDLETPDLLPFIGQYHPTARGLWVATGFHQWGMTNGTLAGMIISDLVVQGESPHRKLFNPWRLSQTTVGAPTLAMEGIKVASHYAKDWASMIVNMRSPKSLQPGEAARGPCRCVLVPLTRIGAHDFMCRARPSFSFYRLHTIVIVRFSPSSVIRW